MINSRILALAALGLGLTGVSAAAGGYTLPQPEPVVVAPVTVAPAATYRTGGDWTGFYAGAQVGKGSGKLSFPATAGVTPPSADTDARSMGLHAGYLHQFGGNFVVGGEMSWDKLSKVKIGTAPERDGSILRAKAIAGYDLGRVLPYATLGVARADISDGIAAGTDLKETGLAYGIGAKFKATEKIVIGAEILKHDFKDVGDVKGRDLGLTTAGVSVGFRF